MRYSLCSSTWDSREIDAIHDVIGSGMFSMGKKVQEFEKSFAEKFGAKYAVMVNSGSSANLVAIAAMVYSGRLHRGDEVIVPAVSWSTTYFPLYQMGLKLRFVDIDRDTLNMDVEKLARAITPDTRMVCLVNLLGNPNEFDQVFRICRDRDIIVMEDNCESLGAEYDGKMAGTFGLVGTFSMFYSHHLYTMEGGMAVTDDERLYHTMLCVRAHGWTRNLPQDSPIYQKGENAFYESFNFIMPGFNMRPLEIEAAAGLVQLEKMDRILAQRRENARHFQERMADIPGVRIQKEVGSSSWYGFAVVLEGERASLRDEIVRQLPERGIEVRPIVAGNFTRNKVIEYLDHTVADELTASDDIHDHGFFVGNYGTENFEQIDYFTDVLKELLGAGGVHDNSCAYYVFDLCGLLCSVEAAR